MHNFPNTTHTLKYKQHRPGIPLNTTAHSFVTFFFSTTTFYRITLRTHTFSNKIVPCGYSRPQALAVALTLPLVFVGLFLTLRVVNLCLLLVEAGKVQEL